MKKDKKYMLYTPGYKPQKISITFIPCRFPYEEGMCEHPKCKKWYFTGTVLPKLIAILFVFAFLIILIL